VDRIEERTVQLVEQSHRLEGIEDGGVVRPALVEHRGHAPEFHVLWQRLQPGLELGLEVVAVNASVPEELEHLDLVRGLDRLRRVELQVVGALRERGEWGQGHCRDQRAAYSVHCCSFTLIKLALIPLCASA
jgi:hypothetical protein